VKLVVAPKVLKGNVPIPEINVGLLQLSLVCAAAPLTPIRSTPSWKLIRRTLHRLTVAPVQQRVSDRKFEI
jgi:hypothetical protein